MENKNIFRGSSKVTVAEREKLMKQAGLVIWLTGFSGAGKSTLAFALEKKLFDHGVCSYGLDGDNLRFGINQDLGFSEVDRRENIRRIAHIAQLFQDAGLIVIVSCISPRESMREQAKAIIGADRFMEVYVKADLHVCQQRDPKGLYKKAAAGAIKNFTGVGAGYEPPKNPKLILDTEELSVEESVQILFNAIMKQMEGKDAK